jgi:hypothetical protein
MDARPPASHPHAWIKQENRVADWWDSKYSPAGYGKETGPIDDERRRVLVINTGLTLQQYEEWDPAVMDRYVCEASQVSPTDIWVDLDAPVHAQHEGNLLVLCKSDTLPSERDELHARGFTYLGSRDDCMYFVDPYGSIDLYRHSDTYYPVPRVRIIIHRESCMCSTYHKEAKPHGAWYWSRVGFDDIPPREPPVQPEETEEALRERVRSEEQHAIEMANWRKRANDGEASAKWVVGLVDMQRAVREAANAEMLKAMLKQHK